MEIRSAEITEITEIEEKDLNMKTFKRTLKTMSKVKLIRLLGDEGDDPTEDAGTWSQKRSAVQLELIRRGVDLQKLARQGKM